MKSGMLWGTLLALAVLFTDFGPGLMAQEPVRKSELSPEVQAFIERVKVAPADSPLRKLLKERHNVAVDVLEARVEEYKKGIRDVTFVFAAARRVAEAKLDLAETPEARVKVLEQTLAVAKLIEQRLQELVDKGLGAKSDLGVARFGRLGVEIELLKAREAARPKP
jgi:hypothetical protein